MELKTLALVGAFSFLFFIPILFLPKRDLEWKLRVIKVFSFVQVIGTVVFVVGVGSQLFMDKAYISFSMNQYNILVIVFLLINAFSPKLMNLTVRLYEKNKERVDQNRRKMRMVLYYALIFIFACEYVVRSQIYHLTF